jgi:hypothetical protein
MSNGCSPFWEKQYEELEDSFARAPSQEIAGWCRVEPDTLLFAGGRGPTVITRLESGYCNGQKFSSQ